MLLVPRRVDFVCDLSRSATKLHGKVNECQIVI
jgi:hypothetical protein